MILQMFAIFDVKAGAYGRPAFAPAVGLCVRSFTDECNRHAEGNDFNAHPMDFSLFHFGNFDDVSGSFTLFDTPVLICRGSDVITKVS